MLDSISRDQLMRALGLVGGERRSTTSMIPDPGSRDQLMRALGVIEARHLPGLHDQKTHGRRGPGAGVAGLVGRFTDALAKHLETDDGSKSPLDAFTRPQLQQIAKARGVKLKRGAGRDDMVKALMGDASKDLPHGPSKVYADLDAGRTSSAPPPPLDQLLEYLKTRTGANLANLEVGGDGNERLFTTHIRDIPRSEMPQLPASVDGLQPFLDRLGEMGVSAELTQVDPRDLVMTQSELDSAKVAKMWGFMSADGWKEGVVMIASREGAILDGHHRWAGAAAAAATGTPISATVLRVDMGIDELLELAQEFSGAKVGIGAAA